MNTHKLLDSKCMKTILVMLPIAISLAMLATVTFAGDAFANVKGHTNTGCTNGGGQNVDDKTTCPSSPPQDQESCNANTGNGKCPKGQNK